MPYTQQHIDQFNHLQFAEDTSSAASAYVLDASHFRPFHVGLREFLVRTGFATGTETLEQTATALYASLQTLGVPIKKETLTAWLTGPQRPKIDERSRSRMYALCFALQAAPEDVYWFFHHVYCDRAFNCHTITGAAYYYTLTHGYSYNTARQIIKTVNNVPVRGEPEPLYTQTVRASLDALRQPQDVTDFLCRHKASFTTWNRTSQEYIHALLQEILGNEETDRPCFEKLKGQMRTVLTAQERGTPYPAPAYTELQQLGLLLRDGFHVDQQIHCETAEKTFLLERIRQQNVFKIPYLLTAILGTADGLQVHKTLPYVIRNNFPSKKVLQDIIVPTKARTATTYDAIRKVLVLLYFYAYWARHRVQAADVTAYGNADYTEIFKDELNTLLTTCGYEELFAGNPYDWLFLSASQAEDPLTSLQSITCTIEEAVEAPPLST